MRWIGVVGSALGAAACTAANPAYEATGELADSTTGGIAPIESTAGPVGSSTGGTTGELDAGGSDAAADSSSSSGDVPGSLPVELCRFDLFGITETGQLHAVDPDQGDAVLLLEDPRLASWAVATDPATGLLYVNELASPTTIWRVDPVALEIDPEPLEVGVRLLGDVARATFHAGNLWIGTDIGHRFVWLPPTGDGIIGDETLSELPRGGDMLFLEEDCAVVPTLDGSLYSACFPYLGGAPPMVPVVGVSPGSQFTGIAIDAMDRLWLSDPNRLMVRIDRSGDPWVVAETIPYGGVTLNDLATVIHPPGC